MKEFIAKHGKYLLYTLLVICLVSCSRRERTKTKQVETFRVIIAKNTEVVNATTLSSGYTKYLLAFNDGWTERTSFGYYSCLQIGDTIRFVKDEDENDYWYEMEESCK